MDNKNVFSEMWDMYRGIVLRSIVTSFGLDFLVRDRTGGDVDTIYSVRETGQYKNERNEMAYQNRGKYDSVAYHHNEAYDSTVRAVRDSHAFFDDTYVPGNRIFYGKASGLGSEHRANLDHVISANEIHNDRGRVLAGLDGVELANQPSNLKFTNEHLNKSMKDMTIEEYIQWRSERGDPLPDDIQARMREADSSARENYNRRIAEAYYSSDQFLADVSIAATKRGVEMGIRQALGFIFIEIWCACEDEVKTLPAGVSFRDCTQAIATGIQRGLDNARVKYKDIVAQFEQGFVAGALASLTTTLINVFISTDKNTVRYIRQIYTTVVQVGNILLINPDDLLLGDQLKMASIALTTGASVLAGTVVGNQIAKTPIGQSEQIGAIVQNFCASLVSGLISCTLLILIDRSKFICSVVAKMNEFGSVDHDIHETSEAFIQLAAEIAQCDISEFSDNVAKLNSYTKEMTVARDNELNEILLDVYREFEIPLPWSGDFDEFMSDSTNCLVFE